MNRLNITINALAMELAGKNLTAEPSGAPAQPTAEGFRSLKDLDIVTVVNLRSYHSDRTGTMTAAYRIVVAGWSKEDAVKEMTSEAFGFHRVWRNLPKWIEELDVESVRQEAGLARAAGG